MQKKLENIFSVFEIWAFQPVPGISFIYKVNTCDLEWTCYQTVLRFRIWIREIFSKSLCSRLIKNWDKSVVLYVPAVFGSREHVSWGRVFENGRSRALKWPHLSRPITSEIFILWSRYFFPKLAKFCVNSKNGIKIVEIDFHIGGFEPVVVISPIYGENTCDLQWTCYQTVLGFLMWLKEMFSSSLCPRLMGIWEQSIVMQVAAVFETLEQVYWRMVF